MNRFLHYAAFVVGLAAILWVAAGYVTGNPLALVLVLLIGVFYLIGAVELHRFQKATDGLVQSLATAPGPGAALAPWLVALDPSLHNAVRLRVEGERVAMPGPALTPYLTGLLVLLGMLGTFLGMVVTLKGTGLALENATDVEAIRASLAAPVKGLGLAFGTSVAGVAASAMLGLMSALVRRERQGASRQLDAVVATTLRTHSRAHQGERQREQALQLLQAQSEAMPALVAQLQALVAQMAAQGQSLQDRLVAGQAAFHQETKQAYTGLAASVDQSLKASLADSARLAGAAIEPAVQATMAGLAKEAAVLRDALGAAAQQQLDGVTSRLDTLTATLSERWQAALAEQQRHGAALTHDLQAGLERFTGNADQRSATLLDGMATRFEQHAASLMKTVADAHTAWDSAAAQREQQRSAAFHDGLAALSDSVRDRAREDAAAIAERQQQICTTLEHTAQAITAQAEAHARATIGEIERLVQAASEAPRAAAEVIGELRRTISDSLVRDNAALDERNRLMGTLDTLLDAVNHASTEQRSAIAALVQTTTDVMERAGQRFAETVDRESQSLQSVATQVTGSAAEVAGLGQGFGEAVKGFVQSNEQLMAQLQQIEAALQHSAARSDEQLAYYVAQAREIVDLTLGTQKQIVDELQQVAQAVQN